MVLLTLPAGAAAAPVSAQALLERGDFSEFDQTNANGGTLVNTTERAFEGARSAHATYSGGGANGYSRGIWEVSWADGDEVWYGAAYFLPTGFHSNIQGQVDLLRWDNWATHPSDTDWGGVAIYGSDRKARLLRFGQGRPSSDTLVGPLNLPEGRWFTLEVHQRLSGGAGALSELYLDGRLVGRSTAPNTYGRSIQRVRYGIVAIASGSQSKPLGLWFDRASMGTSPSAPTSGEAPSEGSPSGEPAGGETEPSPPAAKPRVRRQRVTKPRATASCNTRRTVRRSRGVTRRLVIRTCSLGAQKCLTVRGRAQGQGWNRVGFRRVCDKPGRQCRRWSAVTRRADGSRPRRAHSFRCRRS